MHPVQVLDQDAGRLQRGKGRARIRQAQDILGMRIGIENASRYVTPPGAEMDEASFIRAVVEEADCLLHLDVNNLFVNARNFGFDPLAFLDALPLDRVCYLHIAGHHQEADGLLIDTHGAPVIGELLRGELRATVVEKARVIDGWVAAGKIAPANKEMFLGMCRAEGGVEQFKKFVEAAPVIADASVVNTTTVQQGALSTDELALCRKMNQTPEEYLAAKQAMKAKQGE